MGRALRYVKVQRNADHGGLRYLNPAQVFGAAWRDGTWNQPKPALQPNPTPDAICQPAPAAPLDPARELCAAEAGMREAVRV
ncbi:MAG: hypothetical protein JO326_01995, partial [Acetobacteraceae bacterium]|nr:hypothetical protein [Acetobacteraceae bacterium]